MWLTEWLAEAVGLKAGMRVLDLGCGRGASSIFLRREFGVQVWAGDLWFSPTENAQRIGDAGAGDGVFPLHVDAWKLPFAEEFFDAIVCIDSFMYFATDDHFLGNVVRFVKPGGVIALAGAGLMQEMEGDIPEALRDWWTPELGSLHSAEWYRRRWERSGQVTVDVADVMPEGWERWLDWHRVVAPGNEPEIRALEADRGEWLGYIRVVARRKEGVRIEGPVSSIPAEYVRVPILWGQEPA